MCLRLQGRVQWCVCEGQVQGRVQWWVCEAGGTTWLLQFTQTRRVYKSHTVSTLSAHTVLRTLLALLTPLAGTTTAHLCPHTAGFFVAQALTGAPELPLASMQAATSALAQQLASKTLGLPAAAATALGHIGLRGLLHLLVVDNAGAAAAAGSAGDASAAAGAEPAALDKTTSNGTAAAAPAPARTSSSGAAASAAAPAAGASAAELAAAAAADVEAAVGGALGRLLGSLAGLLYDKDLKAAARAAQALGHISFGLLPPQQDAAAATVLAQGSVAAGAASTAGNGASEAARRALARRLLALSGSKSEEVQFALGEALAFGFGGVPISADTVLCTDFLSLADCFAIFRSEPEGAEAMQVGGG